MRFWRARFGACLTTVAAVSFALPGASAQRVGRQVEDPASGVVWVLRADPAHPGGPGRMVRQGQLRKGEGSRPKAAPVILAGERVAVEEHSAVVDMVLDGVAMEPARAGETFRVRLKPGGQVLRVVAASPGRAAMAVEGVQ